MNTMKKILIVPVVCAAVFLIGAVRVDASRFVYNWANHVEIWSDDGTMVFRWTIVDGRAQSDVYRNGELIYSVHNPPTDVSESSFFLSRDFMHFGFIPESCNVIALKFFSGGVLDRTYYLSDFAVNRRFFSVGPPIGMRMISSDAAHHNVRQDHLRVTTLHNVIYIFDLTTGEVVSRFGGAAWALVYGVIMMMGVAVIHATSQRQMRRKARFNMLSKS